jgi:hypothetical protein
MRLRGVHTLAEDNSAPFVGVTSDLNDISYAKFWIDQPGFFPGPGRGAGHQPA